MVNHTQAYTRSYAQTTDLKITGSRIGVLIMRSADPGGSHVGGTKTNPRHVIQIAVIVPYSSRQLSLLYTGVFYIFNDHFTMPTCAALNCTNRRIGGCEQSFHSFPRSKPEIMKRWIVNLRRDNYKPSKYAVLCSNHFEEHCFDRTGQTVRLRDNAVPTLFKFPAQLVKPVSKRRKPPVNRSLEGTGDTHAQIPLQTAPVDAVCSHLGCDHTYAICESSRSLKRKLNEEEDTIISAKKKLKFSQQKVEMSLRGGNTYVMLLSDHKRNIKQQKQVVQRRQR
ncbi:THAP domain-containing protein 1-like isoform X1 [Oratosquilla oratoria]|uniref:THAP domain-containing protein 1-like isoform X1 n=1 Tax=Oratosquilla oratoria TaxID=337810 RepID=UPI003F7580E6